MGQTSGRHDPGVNAVNRFAQVLFWSVISAAFIGPGTVTTAAAAGAGFGYALLWALAFSTLATLVLQEASARVAIITGRPLATAIRDRYRNAPLGIVFVLVIVGAIVLGCAAYQAGNVLGSVAGVTLRVDWPPQIIAVIVSGMAGCVLLFGSARSIARLLGVVVAVMGASFLVTAIVVAPSVAEIFRGIIVPRLPEGAGVLAIGLVGTTVVPYNLFLGSGIARGQQLADARFGIAVAVILGGIISMGILVVGATLAGEFSFVALADVLARELGGWSAWMFGLGLFAAGLSSAITAPLAAAITAQGLFGSDDNNRWHQQSWRYRGVWAFVLACGLLFGIAGASPVPAIIAAQALNGVLLPLVAIFLFLVVNDRDMLGPTHVNGKLMNALTIFVIMITMLLGARNVLATERLNIELTEHRAAALSELALRCIGTEYPNKLSHVLRDDDDARTPSELHPAFFGCFDWHSSVHGHWMLIRVLKLYPDIPEAGEIRTALDANLQPDRILREVEYLQAEGRASFERTYGWAWLLKLREELIEWDDADARRWSANLAPLADEIVARYIDFLPRQYYAIRTGVHPNTAFGIAFALDYARVTGDEKLEAVLRERSLNYYAGDAACPGNWEPSGEDFFSPCLLEADLMRRVFSPAEFTAWFAEFLPELSGGEESALLTPAVVTDRTDGKLVHLDGLNLSRAWCLYGIAASLPGGKASARLNAAADVHVSTTLDEISSGSYEGEHWLASFALYALSARSEIVLAPAGLGEHVDGVGAAHSQRLFEMLAGRPQERVRRFLEADRRRDRRQAVAAQLVDLGDALDEIVVAGFHGQREMTVALRVFVGAEHANVVGPRADFLQRGPHLLRAALEQPPATHRK